MKLSFNTLLRKLNQLSSEYTAKYYQLMAERQQAHNKMIEESGWTPQEYFDALNKSRADLHKYF
jgi:hypothetical protein